MRTGLLIIFCFLAITGCKHKERIPASIIPQKKMQAILWDMMRADQFLGDFVLNKDSTLDKKKESIKIYQQVFAIHHINKEQFRESFSFYRAHLELFKAIMDSLSQPSTAAPTQMVSPSVRQDSVRSSPQTAPLIDSMIQSRKRKKLRLN